MSLTNDKPKHTNLCNLTSFFCKSWKNIILYYVYLLKVKMNVLFLILNSFHLHFMGDEAYQLWTKQVQHKQNTAYWYTGPCGCRLCQILRDLAVYIKPGTEIIHTHINKSFHGLIQIEITSFIHLPILICDLTLVFRDIKISGCANSHANMYSQSFKALATWP